MAQQHGAAAPGRFHQRGQGVEPGALALAPRLLHLGEPLARGGKIARAPEHLRQRRIAIAARTASFLIIGFQRFGQAGMRHEAHIRLVYPHAEGDGGAHHHVLARHEFGLRPRPFARGEPGMIGARGPPGFAQFLGKLLGRRAAGAIDDAGARRVPHEIAELPRHAGLGADAVADIGPVEARQNQSVLRDAQLQQDILARRLVGGGGEREAGDMLEPVQHGAQQAIIRTKIMAPFAHAMRLVDREERQIGGGQHVLKHGIGRALGRDIEQVQVPGAEALHGFGLVLVDRGQRSRLDSHRIGGAHLVVHQRDERGDDDAGAVSRHRGHLIAERLARAGRHHRQRILTQHDAVHHFRLPPAKAGKAED